jgi:FlaA1/EpsC-like NDP-sugar epimerase
MGGCRLAWRLFNAVWQPTEAGRRLLIYGAGDAGEMIVGDIRNNASFYGYQPIGFVDDDQKRSAAEFMVFKFSAGEKIFSVLSERKSPMSL